MPSSALATPSAATFTDTTIAQAAQAAQATQAPLNDLASHRDVLLRVARRKLRDADLAEDAVHDVFEAVLAGRAAFGGHSSFRTWLIGILQHKITDRIRESSRYRSVDRADDDESDDVAHGMQNLACPQPGPAEQVEQRQLLARVLARMEQLPATLREAARWRLVEDEPTERVCERLGISEGNLFVRLHRARSMLAA